MAPYKPVNPTGFDCVNVLVQRAMVKVVRMARNRVYNRGQKRKDYYAANKEKAKARMAAYYQQNRAAINQACKHWRAANASDYFKDRRQNNPLFILSERCRGRLNAFLRNGGEKKAGHTNDLVCCTWHELHKHICLQLDGRSSSDVEFDHIFPFASYKLDASTQSKVMHYSNLQPLTRKENRKKHTKLPTKAMAAKVDPACWPDGITMDMLPDIYPGWTTPLRM